MSSTLKGNVDLDNMPAVNLVVRFFTPNTDTEVMKACSPTDSDGNFTIYGITPGTYDVGVKASCSLSLLVEDEEFTDEEETEVDFGVLKRGDLTDDDYIDGSDYGPMATYWNHYGPCIGYAGNWLLPECPTPPPAGACYGYVIG